MCEIILPYEPFYTLEWCEWQMQKTTQVVMLKHYLPKKHAVICEIYCEECRIMHQKVIIEMIRYSIKEWREVFGMHIVAEN